MLEDRKHLNNEMEELFFMFMEQKVDVIHLENLYLKELKHLVWIHSGCEDPDQSPTSDNDLEPTFGFEMANSPGKKVMFMLQ